MALLLDVMAAFSVSGPDSGCHRRVSLRGTNSATAQSGRIGAKENALFRSGGGLAMHLANRGQ